MKAILTGATGMVGEGVLHEVLQSPEFTEVLIVNRRPSGIQHEKLIEIVHEDFSDLSLITQELNGYDACFFCLGVSSVGMKEEEYFNKTYTLTMNFAKTLCKRNLGMVFCYVSGASTDSTEKGNSTWARVKGKTENDLMRLPFKRTYNFRPGYMHPTKGLKNTLSGYKYISWMYPLMKIVFPHRVGTLKELGLAMIEVVTRGYDKQVLEVKNISELATRRQQSV